MEPKTLPFQGHKQEITSRKPKNADFLDILGVLVGLRVRAQDIDASGL